MFIFFHDPTIQLRLVVQRQHVILDTVPEAFINFQVDAISSQSFVTGRLAQRSL